MEAARKFQGEMSAGKPQHRAWNNSHVYLLLAASAHCEYYIAKAFIKTVVETDMPSSVRSVLKSLCQLYALYGIQENAGDFLKDGYFSGEHVTMVTTHVVSLLATL
ncbi:peroxisomal acyl-coenzyme A oxidase 2-like [Ptychodera flava]|uniref:peroxisomal acyl-coenzyme A oxidase 2-like n=1 Tax=Ptychodera flava TaxID=63121 RepID=UPI00396A28F3